MNKDYGLMIVFILTMISGFFVYKIDLLNEYKVENMDAILQVLSNSDSEINITLNDNNSKTTEFENVIFSNLEDNFTLHEESSSTNYDTYYLNLTGDKYQAMFKVGKFHNVYNALCTNNITTFGFSLKNIKVKNLFDKYDIKNETELYQYIVNNYDKTVNIISSRDEIEMNYLIKTIANVIIVVNGKLTFIDGDLTGYMYTIGNNQYYEVTLFNDNEKYIFTFANGEGYDYFNIENIKNFISNIKFKE